MADYSEQVAGALQGFFEREASESLQRQVAIEAADDISLDEYLDRYFSRC